ncbi:MAG: histidinol phosphate phosphatase domain-containing protein [Candidatus Thermoplasmatota archaeon]
MYDFHTHTILSDGSLLPSDLIRRAMVVGYNLIAITDHVSEANYENIIKECLKEVKVANKNWDIRVVAGVEITNVPPKNIYKLTKKCREAGAQLIIVHGESIAEPVEKGTNIAGLESDIDILAHPGLITEEEVKLGVEKKIFFELTTRKGHSYTNGHVASIVKKLGGKLLLNTDSHTPQELVTKEFAKKIVIGAGLTNKDADFILEKAPKELIRRI